MAFRGPLKTAKYSLSPVPSTAGSERRSADRDPGYVIIQLQLYMIMAFIPHVERPTADAPFGSVVVRYEYKPLGRALVDAGLVQSAREYAVQPDSKKDPFTCLSIRPIRRSAC